VAFIESYNVFKTTLLSVFSLAVTGYNLTSDVLNKKKFPTDESLYLR